MIFCNEIRQNGYASISQFRLNRPLEQIRQVVSGPVLEMTNCGHDQSGRILPRSRRLTFGVLKRKPGGRSCGAQEQDVIRIDHCLIGRLTMRFPNRPAVKGFQGLRTGRDAGKAAEPNEAIRIVQIAKLPDERQAERFLALNKFPFEKLDQHVALVWPQGVLAKLQNRAAGVRAHDAFLRLIRLTLQFVRLRLGFSSPSEMDGKGYIWAGGLTFSRREDFRPAGKSTSSRSEEDEPICGVGERGG